MQAFDYHPVTSVSEAVALLAQGASGACLLNGGTDLLAQLKEGRRTANHVVDLKRIPELAEFRLPPEGGAWVGAAVTCRTLSRQAGWRNRFPGLHDATHLIGGVQIQGRATVAGNLCNASPAADSVPALVVHGARVHLAGPAGRRIVPVAGFCIAPGRTILARDEMVVAIEIPPLPAEFGAAYLRFTPRNEMDIAVAGAAVAVDLDGEGSHYRSVRVALGAVGPTVIEVERITARLAGRPVAEVSFDEIAALARAAARPITDMRGTSAQRQHLAGVLTVRALRLAISRARRTQAASPTGDYL
ncbi:MAG: xanthine dehydrogenase family protein subunit M [Opitutaceae bacterium]|jgi:CO/xanthine dehydrogenase FAD-binding subunit|nr:xanthine dehydrogenase family protein subunit M [Opitutaceae bacterium]